MTMTLEQKVARLRLVADGLRRIQEFESARYLDEYATHLTQPAQSVDVAGLHSRIGKDLENPRFWLDALRISMHTTDCPEKLRTLTNAHRELSKFVTAALQEKGNG